MTVTFSFPLLESGRSNTGVDKLPQLDGVILVGFKRDFEDDGVVCLAPPTPFAGAGGSGAGDFLDRNGEIEDLSDLEAEDIWEGDWSVERERVT